MTMEHIQSYANAAAVVFKGHNPELRFIEAYDTVSEALDAMWDNPYDAVALYELRSDKLVEIDVSEEMETRKAEQALDRRDAHANRLRQQP